MASGMTRIRIGVHARSDVAAVAQLIAPVLGVRSHGLARRLEVGTVLAGPYSRTNAEEIAEALASFGVRVRLEVADDALTTTQSGMPRRSRDELLALRAQRQAAAAAERAVSRPARAGRYHLRGGEVTTVGRKARLG